MSAKSTFRRRASLLAALLLGSFCAGQPLVIAPIQDHSGTTPQELITSQSGVRRTWFRDRYLFYQEVNGLAIAEGDMVLGPAATVAALNKSTAGRASVVINDERFRWPRGVVPYVIDESGSQNADLSLTVNRAIKHWQDNTTYRFIPLDPRSSTPNYVVFSAKESGCYSRIGMVGGAQPINLSRGCDTGRAVHEIGHAIGMFHEQSRSDRDEFVQVLTENVQTSPDMRYNFVKAGSDGADLGFYDYGSIMHYEGAAFGRDGLETIRTVPAGIPIGQRVALSAGDIDAAERMKRAVSRPYVVTTNPPGLEVIVDGVTCTAPCVFSNWAPGTTHSIGVEAKQRPYWYSFAAFYFARWNDGGTQTHDVTADPQRTVLTANFSTESPADGADLVVTNFTAPVVAAAGESLAAISAEVRNMGKSDTGAFRLGFYISANPVITRADRYIGAFCRFATGIPAGSRGGCSGDIVLPADIPVGVYYLGALADDLDEVAETNELNNWLENQQGVTNVRSSVLPIADLIVSSFSAPISGISGGRIAGTRTEIKNLGLRGTGRFRVGFYLSTTPEVTTNSIFTGWSCAEENGLAAGETRVCAGEIGIPKGLAAGTYYLAAIVDDFDEVPESDETNNSRKNDRGNVEVGAGEINLPDLAIASFSVPTEGIIGERLSGSRISFQNQGTANAGAFRIGYYYSRTPSMTAEAIFSGWICAQMGGLAAGSSESCSGEIGVPGTLTAGLYYLIAVADDLRQVVESDDSNNARAADTGPLSIRVAASSSKPDLTVTGVTIPSTGTTGAVASFAAVVKNQGAASAGPFRVSFYVSTNSVISTADRNLGFCTYTSLGAGAINTCSGPLTIPAGLSPGTYWGGVIVDDLGQVDESAEDNNALMGTNTISIQQAPKPDLTLMSVAVPSNAIAGTAANFAAVVKNQGNASAGPFRVSFYISTNSIISTADRNLGFCTYTSLAAGTSNTCSGPLTIPAGLSPGTYWGGAIVDDLGQVDEGLENNNVMMASNTILVSAAPKPDLTITSVTIPAVGTVGSSAPFAAVVRNQGSTAAGAFRVGFYLSTNSVVSRSDTNIGFCTYTSLGTGTNSTCSGPLTIPAGLSPGTYWSGAIVDDLGQVDESSEDNNVMMASNTISLSPPPKPDLTITSVTIPAVGTVGSTVTFAAVVRNQGSASTGAFRVAFYLSTNSVISRSDTNIGYCTYTSLGAGASSTCSGPLRIPAGLSPGTYWGGAIADDLGQVDESSEGNNVLTGPNAILLR